MDTTLAVLAGLTPSVGVGLLFWFAMRKILRADRHEREALERMDREAMAAAAESARNSASH
jgi:predicted permease